MTPSLQSRLPGKSGTRGLLSSWAWETFPSFPHPPSIPLGKEASPPEQPRPAPPSPTPSLATWKASGVSQAQGEGPGCTKQIQREKTNWLKRLAAPISISPNTHQDQGPAGLGNPLWDTGAGGPASWASTGGVEAT